MGDASDGDELIN